MLNKKIIQFILLFIPFLFKAQTYSFINYGVQDGLAQSNVSAILQDRSGYFWIATESGVSHFDGKNFVTYTTENGLASNNVNALLLDSKGNVWMGHENGMLTRYDPSASLGTGSKNFTIIKSEALPKNKKIYSLYEDKTGSIWICSEAFGAIVLKDPNSDLNAASNYTAYTAKEGLSQYVFSALQDIKNNMWFLTDVGIKCLDASTKKIEFFRPPGMPFGQITSFIKDHEENFILGTSNGFLYKFNFTTKEITPIIDSKNATTSANSMTSSFVYSLFQDSQNNIWASVFNSGVYKFDSKTKSLILFNVSNGLATNTIKSISEDKEGNILLGTLGEGIQVFKGEKFVSFSEKNGLGSNQVYSVIQDKSGQYMFGNSAGITAYDPKQADPKKQFRQIFISYYGARALAIDKNNDVWAGLWGGTIAKYDRASDNFVRVPDLVESVSSYVSCLLVDKKNRLWIGSVDGIAVYDIATKNIKNYRTIDGLSDNDITCLFEDNTGAIWIGTKQKGISVFDGTTFKKHNESTGLTYPYITSIAQDKNNTIWIGTEGGGAFAYSKGKFTKYKAQDGLISDMINLVVPDDKGAVWFGSNKGLSKFENNKFISFTKNDGFTGIETKARAGYKDKEGNLWFGTVNGAFKYSPKYDNNLSLEPQLHITGLKINDQPTPITEELDLSYKENSLRFDFIGISLSNPDEVHYKIKLEGYDEDWKAPSKQTFETYSNLHHGKYIFKVVAINKSGIANKEPASIYFMISPPFWKTWVFYISVTVIGLLIMFTYIKIRERSLIQEKKILEEKVRERTAEVVEKNIELDEKNKDITASIRYAKRIQDAILPPDEYVRTYLPKTFILFKPKDIVSGDFYWLQDKKDIILFAAVDCTGHGVPGAFMSIVGHNALDQIVAEQGLTKPSEILDALNKSVSDTLRQSNSEDNSVKDGMDLALCSFDRRTNVMDYAGAFNPFWLIRNGEFIEIKADKFPIGNLKKGENKKFTNHSVPLQKGDTVYVFSDGYADQFGGPDGKKLKYSTFRKLLLDNQHLSMEEQGELLNKTIESWKGNLEQVDDVLVIGTRL